jgi:multisubunit Na+/H+ antiporter MnhF subunit
VLTQRVDMFIDITLSYALIGFIGVLVLAKYFEQKENERL